MTTIRPKKALQTSARLLPTALRASKSTSKNASLLTCLLILSGTMVQAEPLVHEMTQRHRGLSGPLEEPTFTAVAAWDSLYFLEGRDDLNGEGISSLTLEMEMGGLLLGAWFAHSEGAAYQEQNYLVEYGFDLFGLDAYLSYTHLQFPSDGFDDHEIGAGISVPDIPGGFVPSFDWYYSFDSGGSFVEASLARPLELTDRLELTPALVFGINEGYYPEGHRGANHLALQVGATLQLTESLSLEGYVAYSLAINANPTIFPEDDLLRNAFFGGVALSLCF